MKKSLGPDTVGFDPALYHAGRVGGDLPGKWSYPKAKFDHMLSAGIAAQEQAASDGAERIKAEDQAAKELYERELSGSVDNRKRPASERTVALSKVAIAASQMEQLLDPTYPTSSIPNTHFSGPIDEAERATGAYRPVAQMGTPGEKLLPNEHDPVFGAHDRGKN